MRKFPLRKSTLVLLVLLCVSVLFLTGCTAAWVTGVTTLLLPALQAAVLAVSSFVVALKGKTLTEAFTAAVQKVTSDAVATIANIKTLVTDFNSSSDPSLLGKINALLNGLVANLNGIMSGVSISDPATVSKLTQLIGLAVSAAQAVLAVIPLVQTYLPLLAHMSAAEKESLNDRSKQRLQAAHSELQSEYAAIRTTETANPDVNAALATLPAQLAA